MSGWPGTIKENPPVLQPYWTFCKELTIEDVTLPISYLDNSSQYLLIFSFNI